MYAERLPPQDANAEESVIGSILIDGDSLSRVTSFLRPNDFYGEKNRWCFEAFLALFERGEAINQVTVAHELSLHRSRGGEQTNRLEEIGGSAYLSHLVLVVPTSVHIEYYARIVQRTSIMRQLIDVGGRISEIGYYESDADTDAALSRAEDLLFRIRAGRGSGDFVHIREVLDTYMEESAALHGPDVAHISPVATGFPGIDNLLGNGMQRSDEDCACRPSQSRQKHPSLQHRARSRRQRQPRGHFQP